MAIKITAQGYVKRATSGVSGTGKPFVRFQLSCKTGKDRDGKGTYSYLNCTQYSDTAEKPEDDSYVEVKGSLSESTNVKGDKTYHNLNVFVDSVGEPPPREGGNAGPKAATKPAAKPKWEE